MTMISKLMLCLLAAAALGASAAQASDMESAKAKVTAVCAACHGMDGNSQLPDYPKLSGQHRDYLAKALRDSKTGVRKNPIMAGMAGPLTQQDIENLADYFGSQPAKVATPHH